MASHSTILTTPADTDVADIAALMRIATLITLIRGEQRATLSLIRALLTLASSIHGIQVTTSTMWLPQPAISCTIRQKTQLRRGSTRKRRLLPRLRMSLSKSMAPGEAAASRLNAREDTLSSTILQVRIVAPPRLPRTHQLVSLTSASLVKIVDIIRPGVTTLCITT